MSSSAALPAPFPYFGGKRKVAAEVWRRFGNVKNYVEPFFGSGAVLLGRPHEHIGLETINDADGYVANFWRSVRAFPEQTAAWADAPVNENDLHARHAWLVTRGDDLARRLEGDPDYCDPQIAGWWAWGMSCWIGSGFCSGRGPWTVVDGELINHRQLPHLGSNGQGVNRQLPHLGNNGRGVNRQLPHLGDNGQGDRLNPWFSALSDRMARVRVCCGDWTRACGPSVTFKHGMTAVFLDPPYAKAANRADNLYRTDCLSVANAVREWAVEMGRRPDMRIALCGYDTEHAMPDDWAVYSWNAGSGFGGQAKVRSENGKRERIWFSPACLIQQMQPPLPGAAA